MNKVQDEEAQGFGESEVTTTDLPREKTELRFSVQVIDNRRVPMAMLQTNDEEEARGKFEDLCAHFYWRHLFLVDGHNIIENRPALRRLGKH